MSREGCVRNVLNKIFTNKVVLYLFSRYITYFIQFVSSIYIAVKLGPFYLGIWGFLLLLLNYFKIINFGIGNSLNILMVQYKNDESKVKDYVASSFLIVSIICFGVCLAAGYYYFFGIPAFDKYQVGYLFYLVCGIAILVYINSLFVIIYRVRNSLFEIAFYQSIIPALLLVMMFFFTNSTLLLYLLLMYILGETVSLILFFKGKQVIWGGHVNWRNSKTVLNKGFYLFIYNFCFYLIIVSTRTIISTYYSVEEFGFFTFSYTLANAILLFLEAFSFVIFPKVIDKLNSTDVNTIVSTIRTLRVNYVSFSHGLIYIALIIFPMFLYFVPKYQSTLETLNLIALSIVLYTNSFGYNTYLMARNKETTIAKISLYSLVLNIVCALLLVNFWNVEYTYVILSTMGAYFFYACLCVWHGQKLLGSKLSVWKIINECFPIKLLLPYLSAVGVVILDMQYMIIIPLALFIVMNYRIIIEIINTIKRIINTPEIVDI